MLSISDFNTDALMAAKRARAMGLTQAQIAIHIGASQSQVSRVMSGQSKRQSKLLKKVCKYVFYSAQTNRPDPQSSPELMAALSAVWDGTSQHAQALAHVIRSLSSLDPVAAPDRSKSRARVTA